MLNRRTFFGGLLAASSFPALPVRSQPAPFPNRLVRIFQGYGAGGPTDLLSRICGDHLSKSMGQIFLSESKAGAAGFIAAREVAKSEPDGHTLLLAPHGPLVTAFAVNPQLAFDPLDALTPITLLVRFPQILEVSRTLPVTTFAEFVDYARANNGKLRHGSNGIGGGSHLLTEIIQERYGFTSQHIPYNGTAPYTLGMIQGQVDWAFDVPGGSRPLSEGGHVRLLAVTTKDRSQYFPDVPSLTELKMDNAIWPAAFVLAGPKGMPQEIVDLLAKEFAKVWTVKQNVDRLAPLGLEIWSAPPSETRKFIELERARSTAMIKKLNLRGN